MKLAIQTGSSTAGSRGWVTRMPVSMPRFSAVSTASSLVPARRHSATKAATSGSASSAFASGWSGATAAKVAPQSVSGRVVNTSSVSKPFGAPLVSKLNCRPRLLPIQLRCISRTFSGQCGSPSSAARSSSAMSVMRKNHWTSSRRSTGAPERQPRPSITCSLASTVMSTGSQFTTAALRVTSPASSMSRNSACCWP